MNWSIFRSELKAYQTYTIIWCVALVISTGANIAGNASSLPENLSFNIVEIFAQSLINMVMMAAIFSMILGGLVISREEDEKTIEFLLSHPVTRLEIALSKFAAFTLLILLFNAVLLVADFVFFEIFKSSAGYDMGTFLGLWASELVLIFFFGAAGMLYSAFITKGGAVVGSCIGIPLITGILAMLGDVGNTFLRLLSYLSPYRYLDVAKVLSKGGAQPEFIIVFPAIAVVFIAATFVLYKRKEFAT